MGMGALSLPSLNCQARRGSCSAALGAGISRPPTPRAAPTAQAYHSAAAIRACCYPMCRPLRVRVDQLSAAARAPAALLPTRHRARPPTPPPRRHCYCSGGPVERRRLPIETSHCARRAPAPAPALPPPSAERRAGTSRESGRHEVCRVAAAGGAPAAPAAEHRGSNHRSRSGGGMTFGT